VQGGVGAALVLTGRGIYDRPDAGFYGELGGLFDWRPSSYSPYRFRAAVIIAFQQPDLVLGIVAVQFRVHFLGLDLGDFAVWRLGVDLGYRYVENVTGFSYADTDVFAVGGSTELNATFIDRRLEVGIRFGFPFVFVPFGTSIAAELTAQAAYLFDP
jgi:hypothetical protein